MTQTFSVVEPSYRTGLQSQAALPSNPLCGSKTAEVIPRTSLFHFGIGLGKKIADQLRKTRCVFDLCPMTAASEYVQLGA
ncbi:hypothetical protein R20943_07110 [Paraburkholderia aspalathi]|nr:hypothetical protein R20943_07110 [Paraburkholderia aspalathi]